ncbi:MAG: SMC family ATPase [Candidatus Diapherotrites archaeon]|nr:SMC family ATPase [Candidatus Diapherotrites archaeon]
MLENWRSHYKTDLEFGPGTNVIIGINGAGKSSVLEAIFFALFGPPEKGYYSKILREGATSGKVVLVFEVNGKEYQITREFTAKGQKTAEIRGAKTVITDRPKDVDAEIAKILGMDQKIFKEAVYARQNEIAYILRDASPQERKRLFDNIIELSDFSGARQIVTKLRNRIKRELDIFRGQNWEETKRRKEETIAELEKRGESISRQIAELREKMERAKEALDEYKARLKELEENAKKLSALQQKAAALRRSIEEKEAELKKIEERWGKITEASDADLHNIEERIRHLQEKERQLAALEREIHIMDERAKNLQKRLETAPTTVPPDEKLREKMTALEKQAEQLRKRIGELQAEIAGINEAVKQAMRRRDELEKELQRAKSVERTIQAIVEKYGDVDARLQKIQEEMERATAEIARYRTEVEQERTFIEALQGANRCPVCGSALDGAKVGELIEQHEKNIHSASEAIKTLENRIKELKALAKELEDAKRKITTLRGNVRSSQDIENEIQTIAEEIREKQEETARLNKELGDLQQKLNQTTEDLTKTRKEYDTAIKQRAALEEAERARKELEDLKKTIQEKKIQLLKIKETMAKENISALKREEERIRDMIRAEEISAKLLTERGELETIEEQLKSLAGVESEFRRVLAEANKTEEKIRNMQQIIRDYETQAEYVKIDLEREREELKRIEEQVKTAKKKEELKTSLEKLESALVGTQEVVRNARILAINKVLNIIWREIYPGGDLPEIRLRPTQSDYVLEVKRKSGQWIPVTNLSGGEFYDAALALRIAISAIKNRNLGWLLLDEPTHNLDSDAAEALAQFLNKLPETGLFKQIIIITHDETFRTAATATTYVFTRDKAKGSPTKWEVVGA